MFTDVFNNALLKTIKACYTHFSTKEPCDIVYAEKLQLLFFFFLSTDLSTGLPLSPTQRLL